MATATTTTEDAIILDETNFDVRIHDGYVTMHNTNKDTHRTFQIETMSDDSKFAPGERVVRLLIGDDRDDYTCWRFFGFVKPEGVKVTFKLKHTEFGTFGRMLDNPTHWAAKGVAYLVEAKCRRCGRALTHPRSIASGLGPICEGR